MRKHRLDGYRAGYGQIASADECGNELSISVNCREILEWLRTCSLLRKDSAPWSWLVGWLVGRTKVFLQLSLSVYIMTINQPKTRGDSTIETSRKSSSPYQCQCKIGVDP
jgi:hypothetical protein